MLDTLNIQTGDIILFCGKSNIISDLIRFYLRSPYTHVGILLKDPTYIDPSYIGYYVLESGHEPHTNYGVQITKLDYLLDNYNGKIFYRKLYTRKQSEKMESEFSHLWDSIHNRPYDLNFWDFLSVRLNPGMDNPEVSLLDWFSPDHRKTDTFICSSLVGYVYTMWGFFPNNLKWSEFEPASFACSNTKLHLIEALLGPEIAIK
mgnify:FL=1|jgi:hypothetical protein